MDKESVTRVSAPCAGCNGVDGGDETASVTPTETGSIRRIEEAGARAGEGKSETAEARGLIEASAGAGASTGGVGWEVEVRRRDRHSTQLAAL